MATPGLIDTSDGLVALARELGKYPVLGVDTELNSFFAYREKVCLLQISTLAGDYLIDPLPLTDFSPLADLFADPDCVKIFHDGEQDVQVLQRDLGLTVRGIFDTKIAVMALDNQALGLASLVNSRFDVELDKKCQRSDWGKRPLTEEQLEYALLDTHYLNDLYQELAERLSTLDPVRRGLAEMEFRRLERLEPAPARGGKNGYINVKKASRLRPRELRQLAELYVEREGVAKTMDLPPGRLISDANLVYLAKVPWPVPDGNLELACGLPRRSLRRQRKWAMAALERAGDMPPLEWSEVAGDKGRPDRVTQAVKENIRTWRQTMAKSLEVDSSLVLNRRIIEDLANRRPTDLEGLQALKGIEEWWVEHFGPGLLTAITRW